MLLYQGIDTERPLLQLDNFTFAGGYQDTLGTALFFEDVTHESGKPQILIILFTRLYSTRNF